MLSLICLNSDLIYLVSKTFLLFVQFYVDSVLSLITKFIE
nr:MAG TPA: hypothetical protein [Crassvirales sp.]